ncbi:MAG: hypothetical protein ACU0C9_06945 [Paracoccaceae bacterium]
MNEPPDDIAKPKRRRAARFGYWAIVSVVLLAGLLFIIGLSVSGRNLNAPEWITARVVDSINSNMNSGHITLGRLQVQVAKNGVPRISLGDLGIFDARGTEIIRLNDVGAQISISSLFRRQIKPEQISLSGAQMTLRRRADGQFDISFESGSSASGTLPDVLDLLDAAFVLQPLDQLQNLSAVDLTITLEDARSGRLWQITEGSIQVKRGETGLDISVAFDVFNGTEDLAETVIGIRTDAGSSKVSIGTTFQNAAAADIALQSPVLSFLGLLNAPISGSVRAEFDDGGELTTLVGTLEIGEGGLQPSADVAPVPFKSAKAYFEFEPDPQKIVFSEVSIQSDTASIVAQGQAYLHDFKDGWPLTLLGQFTLSDMTARPEGVFEKEISFSDGAADFRMKLNPFSLEVGQFVLIEGDEKLVASGNVSVGSKGWEIAGDVALNQISHDRLLGIWPVDFSPNTRGWLRDHLNSGILSNVNASIRIHPEQRLRRSIGWDFRDTNVRYIDTQPEITDARGYASIDGDVFTLIIEQGIIVPPEGGPIDVAGSTIQIPDLSLRPAPINVRINGQATTTAVLSLLSQKPFQILRNASFGPDVATGQANFEAAIDFDLKRKITLEDVAYSVASSLENVVTEILIPGRVLSAERLNLIADNKSDEISGPVKLGDVSADIIWRQDLAQNQKSGVSGTVELSQAFVREFGIGLQDGAVQGIGIGQFQLDLVANQPPRFTLNSDLNRLGIQISQIGWRKSKNSTGKLNVAGTLGANPSIDLLEINASGLRASGGRVTLADDGSMVAATFSRVRVGGWLDAPVTLRARGKGLVPSVHIDGGTIDVRKTAFGGADSGSTGAGGPISLALDSVIVSEGITLTNFVGEFDSAGGLRGNFIAKMNGKTSLSGSLIPDSNGTAIRIQSENAGAVLRNAGVVGYAENGSLDLVLRPRPENGVYDGQMQIRDTNVKNAPGMAELLSAISIIGLLEQLSGNGILFEQVDATFQLTPTQVNLIRSSAVGPSLGVSLEGIYDLTTSTMNMQGVVSPVYFLNAIGQIFSRRGEGLFGFNFKLKGTSDAPKVTVNPLSILTPGLFRDIFRAPPPQINQ